jgi:hypothetical protein
VSSDKKELWRSVTLVGHWFIGFGEDHRPELAGRISSGLGAGRYMIAYSFVKNGVRVEPVLNKDQIAYLKWVLFDNQGAWREAFTKAG